MNSGEIIRAVDSLVPTGHSISSGMEKTVCQMRDGESFLAAKVFRTVNKFTEDRINRARDARREFSAYRRLHDSEHLGPYTPAPLYLLSATRGNIVGLGVEWVEAREISRYNLTWPERISLDDIDQLEESLIHAGEQGIQLVPDIYTSANLLLSNIENGKIFLAECRIRPRRIDNKDYVKSVKKNLISVRMPLWFRSSNLLEHLRSMDTK